MTVSPKQRIRRQQLVQQAEGYLELGMPQHALDVLARLDDWDLQDGHAFYLRGEALRSLGRYAEAIEWLDDAVDLVPDNIHPWLALGWCQKRAGRIDLAIDALENALAVDASEAILHYNLACYWSLAKNKAQALDCLAQAFEIDSNYRDLVHDESDFDSLRDDPDFQLLTSVIV
jgi:tetratricopeptide (TPR) repeat protein